MIFSPINVYKFVRFRSNKGTVKKFFGELFGNGPRYMPQWLILLSDDWCSREFARP